MAKAAFVRPTVEMVRQYCLDRANTVDPEAFWDFYESKGWVIGKSPMKCWQAAVRTWERNRGVKPDDLGGIKEFAGPPSKPAGRPPVRVQEPDLFFGQEGGYPK